MVEMNEQDYANLSKVLNPGAKAEDEDDKYPENVKYGEPGDA